MAFIQKRNETSLSESAEIGMRETRFVQVVLIVFVQVVLIVPVAGGFGWRTICRSVIKQIIFRIMLHNIGILTEERNE